jgi:hypothetical protein
MSKFEKFASYFAGGLTIVRRARSRQTREKNIEPVAFGKGVFRVKFESKIEKFASYFAGGFIYSAS